MPQSCLNTFTFSTFAGATAPPELGELLDAVAAAGFDAIGLDSFTITALGERGVTPEHIAAQVRAAGLTCPEMLGFVVEDNEAAVLDGVRQVAATMAALGSRFALGMVTLPPDARCHDLVARCAEIIADAGGRAAIECLPFTPIAALADASSLVRHAGTDKAGVLVDSWHFFHGPDDWNDLAALPLDEIAYIQVDDHPELLGPDADLATVCMTERVMPGDGVLDLERFARALTDKGYDGLVSVEVLSPALAALGPAEFARRAHAGAARFGWA